MEIQEIEEPTRAMEEGLSNTFSQLTLTNVESVRNQLVTAEEVENTEPDGSQKLIEEEVDAFILKEQIAASEGNNTDMNNRYTPQLAMQFKTKDDA